MKLIKTLLFFAFAFAMNNTYAQNLMNIHQGNGTLLQIPLESIDSVRFYTIPPPTIQKIFQSNGNILSLSVSDIDSITYTIPNNAALASITTQTVTILSSSSAYSGGTISSDGGSAITQRGVCWSISPNPTIANNFSVDGSGIGSFGSNLVPLQPSTTYYVRAYAMNAEGTAYGNQLTFTTSSPSTSGSLSTITTANVIYTDGLTASCGGNITADGGLAVTSRGVCWAIGSTPTINNSITIDGAGGGTYSSILPNLLPNTSYFVRAYATNDAGTVYGISYSFTTYALPTVTTNPVTSLTGYTAICGGNISSNGGSNIIQKGVCWSTLPNPTTSNNITQNGSNNGAFSSNITGLVISTTYFVRAYAINGVGVSYGNEVLYTASAVLASVTTGSISNITASTAISGGNIISDGGSPISQYGVCWSLSQNPTTANNTTIDGSGNGSFTSNLISLTGNSTFYVRAYAINNVGTAYGNQQSFTTTQLATLSTSPASSITGTGAISGGNITNSGGATILVRGIVWSVNSSPTLGNSMGSTSNGSGTGTFSSNLTSLTVNTTYYIRAYATNNAGTAYGNQQSFTTPQLATLSTTIASSISGVGAISGGNITNSGGANITSRGIVWSNTPNPSFSSNLLGSTNDGNGIGSFTSNITLFFLYPTNTTYYIRAYATNSAGTAYGNQQSFTLFTPGSGVTYNGHSYSSVVLGNGQEWMSENLQTANYRNGDPISTGLDNTLWSMSAVGSYSFYNNDITNNAIYGKLYNWFAVADPRHLCPIGWHEPTDGEWTILTNYLGGIDEAGIQMRTTDLQYWICSNPNTMNPIAFSGLPGGLRQSNGPFYDIGVNTYWWSSSGNDANNAWDREIGCSVGISFRESRPKRSGFSVRCIRD